jgi:predicted transcriptional regulator
MDVLWEKGEATVKEVQAALEKERVPAYTTVATLLNRLRDRGYVAAEERNFAYVYKPLVEREQVVRRKLDDVVRRILGGKIAPLAAYIAEKKNLTPEQLKMLKDIIEKAPEDDNAK